MGRAAWKIVGERVSGYRQASIADEKGERTQKWDRGTRGGVSGLRTFSCTSYTA